MKYRCNFCQRIYDDVCTCKTSKIHRSFTDKIKLVDDFPNCTVCKKPLNWDRIENELFCTEHGWNDGDD